MKYGVLLTSRHAKNSKQAQASFMQEQLKALAVDDSKVCQFIAASMLCRCGFIAEVAGNGREAVRSAGNASYSIILMDCNMPELDGLDASLAIREAEKSSQALIIGVSASMNRDECLAAGMNDFISKPLLLQSLQAVLKRWGYMPGYYTDVESPRELLRYWTQERYRELYTLYERYMREREKFFQARDCFVERMQTLNHEAQLRKQQRERRKFEAELRQEQRERRRAEAELRQQQREQLQIPTDLHIQQKLWKAELRHEQRVRSQAEPGLVLKPGDLWMLDQRALDQEWLAKWEASLNLREWAINKSMFFVAQRERAILDLIA